MHDHRTPQTIAVRSSRTLRVGVDAVAMPSRTVLHHGRSLGRRAAQLLWPILFNSSLSVGAAWISALCYSRGNIFSLEAPGRQSRRTFLVAILLWVHVFFCGTVWLARSVSLFRLHLLSDPQKCAGAPRMLFKMFRYTIGWFLVSAAALSAIGYGFGGLGETWRKYRPEIYASSFWYYSSLPVADRAARRIYRLETVEGQKLQHERQHSAQHSSALARSARARTGGRRCRGRWLSRLFHGSVVLIAFFVPIAYVHSISSLGVATVARYTAAVTVASLALKITMQELAKIYILRTKIRNARAMALLVALPTVLIDTQVRIVLLRFQSVQLAVSTTLALAFGEVLMRLAKAKWLQRQIRKRESTISSRRGSGVISVAPLAPPRPPQREQDEQEELVNWRVQLHQYHATELCADMYAEYLAIGCSSAITVIFGDSPQFLLRSDSLTSPRVAASLLAQVAIEVVVDFVSCAAELASSLELPGEHERAYFLVFFVALGIVNVNTSAILYLAY